jgi:DNA-binding PadR family transcriptional regulator
MVKALILYYLSIKATHGYEIQKFIQVSGIDKWTKIQSGSIYYALGKLEKEKLVILIKEEKQGARIRKIYSITDKGRIELESALKVELGKEIVSIGSDKLFIYNMLNKVAKSEIIYIINEHIEELKEKNAYWSYWKEIKINEKSLEAEVIAFDMNISSIDFQIKWHEALLKDIDSYIDISKQQEEIIRNIDFGEMDDANEVGETDNFKRVQSLRDEIICNPEDVKLKIDELISLLTKKS